jgi:hypothetical protein
MLLPGLASDLNPPDYHLPHSWNRRHLPPCANEMRSHFLPQASLKLWSPQSRPPKQLGLQVWAITPRICTLKCKSNVCSLPGNAALPLGAMFEDYRSTQQFCDLDWVTGLVRILEWSNTVKGAAMVWKWLALPRFICWNPGPQCGGVDIVEPFRGEPNVMTWM